jgi:hypothetical protein
VTGTPVLVRLDPVTPQLPRRAVESEALRSAMRRLGAHGPFDLEDAGAYLSATGMRVTLDRTADACEDMADQGELRRVAPERPDGPARYETI